MPVHDPFVFQTEQVFNPAVYHHFYRITPERTAEEIAFMREKLPLPPSCRILDLACGHGRHANALAALGHTVTGVDISTGFIAEAQAAAKALQVAVDYRVQDMRTFTDTAVFDVALCLFTAFGYFTDVENAQVLRSIARSLVPGGRFLIDIINRDRLMRALRQSDVKEQEGDLMIDRAIFDSRTGRCITHRTCLIGQQRFDASFSVRLYHLQEMESLFIAAGLELEQAWGDWKGAEVGCEHPRLLLVARKTSG